MVVVLISDLSVCTHNLIGVYVYGVLEGGSMYLGSWFFLSLMG